MEFERNKHNRSCRELKEISEADFTTGKLQRRPDIGISWQNDRDHGHTNFCMCFCISSNRPNSDRKLKLPVYFGIERSATNGSILEMLADE